MIHVEQILWIIMRKGTMEVCFLGVRSNRCYDGVECSLCVCIVRGNVFGWSDMHSVQKEGGIFCRKFSLLSYFILVEFLIFPLLFVGFWGSNYMNDIGNQKLVRRSLIHSLFLMHKIPAVEFLLLIWLFEGYRSRLVLMVVITNIIFECRRTLPNDWG